MDELIVEFLTETTESLNELDNDLILLEQDPDNDDLLSKIFRVMHTIKGTCGFLGLPRMGMIAHAAEDLLGLFRDGKLQASPASVSLILESLDTIKGILRSIEQAGKEPEGDDSSLINRLHEACSGNEMIEASPEQIEAMVTAPCSSTEPQSVPENADPVPVQESSLAAQSLRVSVETLENLMTMVSELVLTRNQILQVARTQKDTTLSTSLQRLNHIVSDLQEGVMKTRMQPVGNAWSKLPRIVRDISSELGKKIELEMLGQETELDRQVLEMIKDPLTHMVRNAADHGIELPEDRVDAGKPEAGKIKLSSWHEGGHIIIEISDDGKGLPLERIKRKIIENHLATEAELSTMSMNDIQQYIFHAGFSTAEKVTSVSGRGVGMDVVKSNIQKISGSIEMKSAEGKGTTFTIKIPLTLAIVSALIVGVGEDRFAIPQLDVRELVMISPQSASKIETVNGTPLYRLRDRLLPLIDLRKLLGMEPPAEQENAVRYITAIRVGAYSFGLIVDKVFDTEEIVVKPVTSLLRHLPVFSGNTILGDGHVIMILDPSGIMSAAGIDDTARQTQEEDDKLSNLLTGPELPLLLFEDGHAAHRKSIKAVPLNNVSRLEEIDMAQVEFANGQAVIQYRNSLMPVYRCDGQPVGSEGRRPVIVFSTRTGLAGLIVNRIFDITNYQGEVQINESAPVSASVIVQGHATDIINLDYKKMHNHKPDPIDADIDFSVQHLLNGSNGHAYGEAMI